MIQIFFEKKIILVVLLFYNFYLFYYLQRQLSCLQRAALSSTNLTKVTLETFLQWKEKKVSVDILLLNISMLMFVKILNDVVIVVIFSDHK